MLQDPGGQWALQETYQVSFSSGIFNLALAECQVLLGLRVQARTLISCAKRPTFATHQPCAGRLPFILSDSFIHTSRKHFPSVSVFTHIYRDVTPQIFSNVPILCHDLSEATQLGRTDPESESGPSDFKAPLLPF